MTTDIHRNGAIHRFGEPVDKAAGAVVLLHGRGGSAEDILQLGKEMYLPGLAYLAPQAANNTWYPYSFLAPIEQNEPWLTSALNKLGKIVEDISHDGIPREKIVIAGFSQGACLASEFVARNAVTFGGLIAFSGGLIGPPGTEFRYAGNVGGTRAFFFGGADPDVHVPWQRVRESASVLSAMAAEVLLRRYPGMPHTTSQQEIEEAKKLILKTFGSIPAHQV